MKKQIKISASLLSANFLQLGLEIEKSEAAGLDSFHLDIMDGHFVPNISFGPVVIKHIRQKTKLPLITHLMIDNPWLYLNEYINCQVDSILLHIESFDQDKPLVDLIKKEPRVATSIDLEKLIYCLQFIKGQKIKAGVAINPGTSIDLIKPILKELDLVLIMSVNPGFSGQSFMPEVLPKIEELRSIFNKEIEIDGGINEKTAPLAIKSGADTLITASYLYSSKDYKAADLSLRV